MRSLAVAMLLLSGFAFAVPAATPRYALKKTIPVPGNGGWDYLIVDDAARRLYVSHGSQVEVLDADTCKWKGKIADTDGVHGIALAPELDRGFTSNGKSNSVTIFGLSDLKVKGHAKTGKNPDAILYDPATKQVFAFNGGGKSATVIDAKAGTVTDTIKLSGRPEFAVADGAGNVFVNIEDKNTLVKIDARKLKVVKEWPLGPGEKPASLAMDVKGKRLFAGCRNKLLVVVNAETGKVVAKVPIGASADATVFEPATGNVFTSCGDGTLSIYHANGDDKYSVVETIKTKARSKTMALDRKTHRLFVPSADFKPADAPKARPTIVPKSFAILVYEQ